jgi:tripartite-type tricarboxylate transporter receptor subunit TctC
MPTLPTFAEAGVKGYEAGLWYSLLAPAKTPRPVVDKLNAALVAALKSTEVAEQLSRQGFETQASTPEELKAYIAREMARWEKVINDNGIKVSL